MAIKAKHEEKPVRRHAITATFRFTPEQDDLFRKAADRAGLTYSAWVRERLLAVARKEVRDRQEA
jgi:uncharacterized protein (DUF1778 family)